MITFFSEGLEAVSFNFGLTALGSTNRIEVEVMNKYTDKITLTNPYSEDSSVRIVDFDSEIPFQGIGKVILEFSPDKSRKESLKKAKIGFKVIIG